MKPKTTLNLLFSFKTSYLPLIILSSAMIYIFFYITTSKTDKYNNIKNSAPQEKYYYAIQIANF